MQGQNDALSLASSCARSLPPLLLGEADENLSSPETILKSEAKELAIRITDTKDPKFRLLLSEKLGCEDSCGTQGK